MAGVEGIPPDQDPKPGPSGAKSPRRLSRAYLLGAGLLALLALVGLMFLLAGRTDTAAPNPPASTNSVPGNR